MTQRDVVDMIRGLGKISGSLNSAASMGDSNIVNGLPVAECKPEVLRQYANILQRYADSLSHLIPDVPLTGPGE